MVFFKEYQHFGFPRSHLIIPVHGAYTLICELYGKLRQYRPVEIQECLYAYLFQVIIWKVEPQIVAARIVKRIVAEIGTIESETELAYPAGWITAVFHDDCFGFHCHILEL